MQRELSNHWLGRNSGAHLRVYLTSPELETDAGKQLLEMTVRIAADGKLGLAGIKELRRWLRANKDNDCIAAIRYLHEIMSRITADGVIDRDELIELQLAVERVIPASHRPPIIQARKKREAARRERLRESRRTEREQEKKDRELLRVLEYARRMRLRHAFASVAGVTFPNDDGSERQDIIKQCRVGEHLVLRHDVTNQYSGFATQVLRTNGEQLGHAPDYLAERIVQEVQAGYKTVGVLKDLTGGTWDKPTRGVNFLVVFAAQDVTSEELQQYMSHVFAIDNADQPEQVNVDFAFGSPEVPQPQKPWWKFW
jgi:hypothetical protein